MASHAPESLNLRDPREAASVINAILELPEPQGGTRENGWFAGYGCRWCRASQAWITVVPFGQDPLVERLMDLFKAAGCKEVVKSNEGGLGPDQDGQGVQVSAYI